MKYLKTYESFDSDILYHGSPHKFTEFSLEQFSKTSDMAEHGYGVYLTDDEKQAEKYSKGGYVYKVKLDSDINLVDWSGKVTQETYDKVSEKAIELGIIDRDILDEVKSVAKSNEEGVTIGFKDIAEKHGQETFRLTRIFSDDSLNSKYPMTFDELYYNLYKTAFDDDMKEASEFLVFSGIDGAYFNEEGVKFTTYVIFNLNKIRII